MKIDSVQKSIASGVAMIHQELSQIPKLSVAENFCVGSEPVLQHFPLVIDKKKMIKPASDVFRRLGLNIDPTMRMGDLSIAEMQMVEIAKAVSRNAKIVIMDEPTSAITDREVEKLFEIIESLKRQGTAIIYISHKMDEVFRISDMISVMRDGHMIGTQKACDLTEEKLVPMLVGREITDYYSHESTTPGDVILEVRNLSRKGKFEDISFSVRKGEILGIAGLMGAYGAALYGLRQSHKNHQETSRMMNLAELEAFDQKVVSVKCGGCGNHCQLTVNTFADGRKFISGNRCDKPVTGKSEDNSLNLYAYKQQLLASYKPVPGKRGSIGIPLCLGFYELLPFWWAFWTKLGFAVHTSPVSSRGLYLAGQATIPSDTACFPAKLSHGHIKALSQMQLDAIFYPCLTYNFDEGLGDNHYNCPVVAYYPEVLAGNCPELEGKKFIYDYVGIHRPKDFVRKMAKEVLPRYFGGISEKEVQAAADAAYAEHEAHMAQIRVKGSEIIDEARRQGRRIIVLAGRPYHVDPEVNHGIDHLITRHGAAVITEDSISDRVEKFPTSVLNQWTYHSRLYAAAKYCTTQKDMDLVQLVSFGCGVDAITTDETREILQEGGKLYTQLKIDEITNLGAVNIRLRSLFAALDERDEDRKG